MGVSVIADSQSTATGTRGTKYWTITTLATHFAGELAVARNASGGTVPTRLEDIIYEAYGYIWEIYEWNFRRRRGTLTTVASTGTVELPAAFGKTDQVTLKETSGALSLRITSNVEEFEEFRQANTDSDGTVSEGQPRLGFIEVDTSKTEYRRLIRMVPTPDAEYNYVLYHFNTAPSISTTECPVWPPFMFRIWKLLSEALARKAFRPNDDGWQAPYAAFKSAMDWAKNENDEDMASDAPVSYAGLDDYLALPSAQFSRGFG